MKPFLKGLTIVMVDMYCNELSRLALAESLERVTPEHCMIFSPTPTNWGLQGTEWYGIPELKGLPRFFEFLWYDLPWRLKTSHYLILHWDSAILDAGCWTDEFLEYDWMGPPWNDLGPPWNDPPGLNVGEGHMRSTRLVRHLALNKDKYPMPLDSDDLIVSKRYRPMLEKEGFKWPSEKLAARFGLAYVRPSKDSKHFMFHGVKNFSAVFSGPQLEQRMKLVRENDYIRNHPYKMLELQAGPNLEIWPHLA